MEFLGPLFAMGMFKDIGKSSESGESMNDDEMKSFQEFVENNIMNVGNKYKCKLCDKQFSTKDATVKHIGNKHEFGDDEDD